VQENPRNELEIFPEGGFRGVKSSIASQSSSNQCQLNLLHHGDEDTDYHRIRCCPFHNERLYSLDSVGAGSEWGESFRGFVASLAVQETRTTWVDFLRVGPFYDMLVCKGFECGFTFIQKLRLGLAFEGHGRVPPRIEHILLGAFEGLSVAVVSRFGLQVGQC
jgi:hypothetical protein